MESKKINQLATSVSPSTSDLAIIGDPITGVSKKITWLQVSTLIGTAANLQQVTDNGNTTTNSIAIGGLTITGFSTGVLKSDSGVISSVPFGAANGVATLAGDGKVPSSQLPSYVDDVVEVANYAALPTTGETGKLYITLDNNKVYRWGGSVYVEVAANTAVWGSITGTLSNQTDLQNALNAKVPTSRTISINGTSYDLSANRTWSVGTLTSVGLTMPSGFTVASSPLTGAGGTIAVTGAGASTQYIDGTGALQTFPTLLSSDNLVKLVRNQSGATMTAGTIVYISGATGNKPLIAKALATGDSTSAQTYGLLQADIANNADGYVVVIGNVGSLDTSALTEGQQLYLSGTTAGAYTTTKPYAPTHLVYVGIVLRSHPVSGIIGVKIQNGYEMDELHNVDAQSPSNNDILSYNTSTSLWEHKQIATTLGYTPISLSSLSATSPLSYNNGTGAFSIQVASSTQNGYLSSTDWSTFNNKQAALGGTGFVKISGSTISYDNSTYYLASNPSGFITLASLSGGTGISYSNITGVISSTITQYTDTLSRAAISSSATGLTYTSSTGVFSLTTGYSIPTTAKQTEWDTAYTNRITSLTTTGSSGAATLVSNTLNVPTYTLSGLGGVPTSRTLTINGIAYDLSADRTWTIEAYSLPIASASVLGGIKVGSNLSINATTGVLDATYSYTLPTASTSVLGGVKVDGTTITINGSGVISGANTYSLPIATSSVLGGVKIGSGVSVDVNGVISVSTNYQAPLNGTGFVKASGTTISYDNSTYLTTSAASSTYLPLAGGTLTGQTLVSYAMGADNGFVIQHSNLTQGISIGYNTIKASGTNADQNLNLYSKGTGVINLVSNTQVNGTFSTLSTSSFGGNLTASGIGKFWDGTQGLTIGAYPSGSGYGAIYLASLTPTSSNYSAAFSSTESVVSVPVGGSISLCVEASAKVRVNSNGYVRIGSVAGAANERLDVDGAVQVRSDSQGYSTTTSVGMLDFYAGYTRLLSFGANSSTYGGFEFYAAKQNNGLGYTALRMFPSGNLSINNTTDSGYKLDVTGTTRVSRMIVGGTATSRILQVNTSGNDGIRIMTSGDNPTLDMMQTAAANASARNWRIVTNWEGWGTMDFQSGTNSTNDPSTTRMTISGTTGGITIQSLAGTGTRIVGADSNGLLSGITIGSGLSLSGGTLTATGGSAGTITGSGANGQVAFFTSASNIGSSSSFLWDNTNGKLGIGFQGGAKLFIGAAANNTSADISTIAQLQAPRATIGYPLTLSVAGSGVTGDQIRMTFNYGVSFSATAYVASYLDNATTAATGLTFGTYNGGVVQSMRLTAAGKLLIVGATDLGAYQLQVTGKIYATDDIIAFSDVSVKKNIRTIDNALERVNKSRGVIYDRNDIDSKNNIGFIAQELELEFPELISVNDDGTKGVKYQNAVAVLFEAIKEQQKQIDKLKKQVA